MPQLRCPDLSAELVELYRAEGVDVLLETQVEELTGQRPPAHRRAHDGRRDDRGLPRDRGGRASCRTSSSREEAGAEVDDGIVVDERFRTSLPDVYAIGDVARYPDPTLGTAAQDRALVERRRPGRAPRPAARGLPRRRTTRCPSSSRSSSGASSRCSATSSGRRNASCAGRSPRAPDRLPPRPTSGVWSAPWSTARPPTSPSSWRRCSAARSSSTTRHGSLDGNLRPAEAVVAVARRHRRVVFAA